MAGNCRNRPRHCHQDRRQHGDGSHRRFGFRSGYWNDSHRPRDCPLYPSDHGRGRLPRRHLFHHRPRSRLPMARRRHLLDRHHCGQRARRPTRHRHCLPDVDGQAHGQQELFGQELGSCRNARLHFDHLLGQDWNSHTEPNDGRPHVVRRANHRGRHH